MNAQMLAILLDGVLLVGSGVFGTLIAFRVIGPKAGVAPAYDETHQRYLKWFRWGGPLVVFIGVVQAAIKIWALRSGV